MVKVLRCYHFKSQTVVPCNDEPVSLFATDNRLFVATTARTIEVYDLTRNGFPRTHCFNTENLVSTILHNEHGDYLATLETKKSILAEYQFVKVYLKWTVDPGKQPMKVRIAGKPYGVSPKDLKSGKAEVIDVPVSGKVTAITTCLTSSNLAVVADTKVVLYRQVVKPLPSTDHTYKDFELILQICWDSALTHVALCADYVACLNETHAQLIKLSAKSDTAVKQSETTASSADDDNKSLTSSFQHSVSPKSTPSLARSNSQTESSELTASRPNFEHSLTVGSKKYSSVGLRASPNPVIQQSEQVKLQQVVRDWETVENDEQFICWDFNEHLKQSTEITKGQKVPPKTIFLKGFHGRFGGGSPLNVPIHGKPVLPEVTEFKADGRPHSGGVEIKVLIQVKQRSSDQFKAIQILPTYGSCTSPNPEISDRAEPEPPSTCPGSPPADTSQRPVVGICCFLEAGYTGAMYSVLPTPQLLSHYKFASEALRVVCGASLLHVITAVGVETYTARRSLSAVHATEFYDNVRKTCPPADLETCLISIQPFIGIRQVALSSSHLNLLTKVETKGSAGKTKGGQTSWSLYALEESLVTDMYKDMVLLGTRNQESSPPTYLHLLLEGYIALTSHLMGCPMRRRDVKVLDLLSECSALLGDYYSQAGCPDWRLALPYYLMSGLRVEDILRQADLQRQIAKTQLSGYGQGLMNYLHHILFVRSPQPEIKQVYNDMILKCFAESHPENLSRAILFGAFQNYSPGKAVSLLENSLESRKDTAYKNKCVDLLCVAVLSLRQCDPEKALSALVTIPKKDVTRICVENSSLLHDRFKELSPLSQLMRQHYPQVFITILVALLDAGTIPLNTALTLLKRNVYQSEVHKNTHVREYLEAILKDEKRQHMFDEAAVLLSDIYLQRLLEWKPPSSRELPLPQFNMPKGSGYFGSRYSWLDFLPPLISPKHIKQPCHYLQLAKHGHGLRSKVKSPPIRIDQQNTDKADCPCCLCNEDLLKLQAMLCSRFVTEKIVRLIMDRLQGNESSRVYESLWLLSVSHVDFRQSVDIIVEKYPQILPEFISGSIGDDTEKLRYTLDSLMLSLRKQATSPSTQDQVYVDAVKGVLNEMTSILPPAQFISLLPSDGSLLTFLPYIVMCCQVKEVSQLKTIITRKGEELSLG